MLQNQSVEGMQNPSDKEKAGTEEKGKDDVV